MYKRNCIYLLGVMTLAVVMTACAESANKEGAMNTEQTGTVQQNRVPTEAECKEKADDCHSEAADSALQILVNKTHSLGKDEVPPDLVTVDVPTVLDNPEVNQMKEEAAQALKELFGEAEKSGMKLYARSGYRSYRTQVALFQGYMDKHGEEAANRFSAKAGQSEHQTGLVMDITSDSASLQLSEQFGETDEGRWVSENAHKHGFIIRYPKGKEAITGYIYEPWHLRYLGVDLATKVYESGLTFEEYLVESQKAKSDDSEQGSHTNITLAAAGDIMFHKEQLKSGYDPVTKSYDFKEFFEEVKPIISAADIAIANFETTTGGTETYEYMGYPRFNSPDEVLDSIQDAGFDVMATANNHSLDTGKKGLIRTLEKIKGSGMDSVGTYAKRPGTRVLMKEIKGVKLAFLSYTESTNGLANALSSEDRDSIINIIDEQKIKEDIQYAKDRQADVIIAFVHWGNEYERKPTREQVKWAQLMAEEGVGIILGSHPHVIQRSEQLKLNGNSAFVVYSMGNFISNQRTETLDNEYTEDGIIIHFEIRKNNETNETKIVKVKYIPTWVYRNLDQGQQAFTYRILPIESYADKNRLSEDDKRRMQRSYKDTIAQMNAPVYAN
ncbi:CapA family protein [Cohnella herbarum]|uniref:Capsule synthesis protein CapA domain-containing protein n=1 Tax=Cohnella herbarum TaxID=2728023 RepID=A0A7Z2VIH0_9BACL|nr:CapA family protein [Cohnella herbarum]QJD83846.1 hypothetical protein HH215_12070 [Cohnella herbarum]